VGLAEFETYRKFLRRHEMLPNEIKIRQQVRHATQRLLNTVTPPGFLLLSRADGPLVGIFMVYKLQRPGPEFDGWKWNA
jgi:hypothetical protein